MKKYLWPGREANYIFSSVWVPIRTSGLLPEGSRPQEAGEGTRAT
ncbi:hypothetical protein [Dehalobacter sp. TeCB1]|nr:hypothetical protein [Dehalobacter sp. TeCB1]